MLSWLLVTVRPQTGEAGKVKSKLSSSPGLSLGLADKGHCPGWQMGDSRQETRAMSTGLLKGCWRSQHSACAVGHTSPGIQGPSGNTPSNSKRQRLVQGVGLATCHHKVFLSSSGWCIYNDHNPGNFQWWLWAVLVKVYSGRARTDGRAGMGTSTRWL